MNTQAELIAEAVEDVARQIAGGASEKVIAEARDNLRLVIEPVARVADAIGPRLVRDCETPRMCRDAKACLGHCDGGYGT